MEHPSARRCLLTPAELDAIGERARMVQEDMECLYGDPARLARVAALALDAPALLTHIRAQDEQIAEWRGALTLSQQVYAEALAKMTADRDAWKKTAIEAEGVIESLGATIAELRAELANERGEGSGPSEGWAFGVPPGPLCPDFGWWKGDMCVWHGPKEDDSGHCWYFARGIAAGVAAPSARQAMRTALAPKCATCGGSGYVGNILDSDYCPDCGTPNGSLT